MAKMDVCAFQVCHDTADVQNTKAMACSFRYVFGCVQKTKFLVVFHHLRILH